MHHLHLDGDKFNICKFRHCLIPTVACSAVMTHEVAIAVIRRVLMSPLTKHMYMYYVVPSSDSLTYPQDK